MKKTYGFKIEEEQFGICDEILKKYQREGEQKGEAFMRIVALAEAESVKGTHPELAKAFAGVQSTIDHLIQQMNGVIAGSDEAMTIVKKELQECKMEKAEAYARLRDMDIVISERDELKKEKEELEAKVKTLEKRTKTFDEIQDDYIKCIRELDQMKETMRNAEAEKERAVFEKEREMYQQIADLKAQITLMQQK